MSATALHPSGLPFHGKDVGRGLLWACGFFTVFLGMECLLWWAGSGGRPEYPWTLALLATLLVFAARHGNYLLVLGLCGVAYFFKTHPAFAAYFFTVGTVCYILLHTLPPRAAVWFYGGFLVVATLVFPKLWQLWDGNNTGGPSWLYQAGVAGLFVRYAYYFYEWRRGTWKRPGYFEHLSYTAFIPQLWGVLAFAPSRQWHRCGDYPGCVVGGLRMLGLAVVKIACFKTLNLLPLGTGVPDSAWAAWVLVLLHYFKWFLWLSGHFDLAVALCRLLGARIPPNFKFPLLAPSPVEFWRRWNVLLRKMLMRLVYFPLGGSRRLPFLSIMAMVLVAALLHGGWLWSAGLLSELRSRAVFPWLVFFLLQGLLLCANVWWRERGGLERRVVPEGWRRWRGIVATQLVMAWLHVPLMAVGLFPGAPGLDGEQIVELTRTAWGR